MGILRIESAENKTTSPGRRLRPNNDQAIGYLLFLNSIHLCIQTSIRLFVAKNADKLYVETFLVNYLLSC